MIKEQLTHMMWYAITLLSITYQKKKFKNTNTNYNSDAEKKAFGGMKGMLELAKFLGSELEKLK
jgi:hypothetical protein